MRYGQADALRQLSLHNRTGRDAGHWIHGVSLRFSFPPFSPWHEKGEITLGHSMSGKAGVGWNLILLVYISELKEGALRVLYG